MPTALTGGGGAGGPDGTVVVLALLAALVVVPLAFGLVLRLRDRSRDRDGASETRVEPHRTSSGTPFFLAGAWGRNAEGDELTRQAWWVVAGLTLVIVVMGCCVLLQS